MSDWENKLRTFQLHKLNIVSAKLKWKTCFFVKNLRKFQLRKLERLHKLDSDANSNRKTCSLSIFPCCAIAIALLVQILKTGRRASSHVQCRPLAPFPIWWLRKFTRALSHALFSIWCQLRKSESHSNLMTLYLKTHSGERPHKCNQFSASSRKSHRQADSISCAG